MQHEETGSSASAAPEEPPQGAHVSGGTLPTP